MIQSKINLFVVLRSEGDECDKMQGKLRNRDEDQNEPGQEEIVVENEITCFVEAELEDDLLSRKDRDLG